VSHEYSNIRRFKDLPEKWLEELEKFFVNYAGQQGKDFRVIGVKDEDAAMQLVQKARKNGKQG
jgi:inorganic pyrophosphatase